MSSMKNVDVAWIDVVRVWWRMTGMLLSHPGFESVGLNSWVLGTATMGLKQKRRKRLPHCLLKATPQTPEIVGNPQKWNERCNSSLKSHLFLAASASKKFTIMIRILQLVTSGEITIFRTMPLSYIYIVCKKIV